MKRRLIMVLAVMTILSALTLSSFASEPICFTAERVCEQRANAVWNECRAEGGWYPICYIVWSDTRGACYDSYHCPPPNY